MIGSKTKNHAKIFCYSVGAILLIIGTIYFIGGKYVYVIANEDILIHSSLQGFMADSNDKIGLLKKGAELPVIRCHDVKHYIVLEVEMSDGIKGFMLGDINIRRERAAFSFSNRKVFNCPLR